MIFGYMRPAQEDTDCKLQEQELTGLCAKLVKEEHSSAKKRTVLHQLLEQLNKGDKIVVCRLFTLADSSRHLFELLEILEQKGAYLQTLHEDIDMEQQKEYSLKKMVGHLVEFQNEIISERTKKGMEFAKKKGISTGRPRKADENVKKAIEMYQSKRYSLNEIKEATGISKSTLYRYLEN
ncbi:recombinase family protein [Niallia taxi]|uniref:recombinase family protein n=1 Tax=Niallia taxi TaxID=2499688 RepID=UPI002E1F909C|nr:recombinase family protein [Niallia taxi]